MQAIISLERKVVTTTLLRLVIGENELYKMVKYLNLQEGNHNKALLEILVFSTDKPL